MTEETGKAKIGIWERMTRNATFRITTIGILILLMLIPLSMVESIVHERRGSYDSVLQEISGQWGSEQLLVGPILVVPFTEYYQVAETRRDQEGKEYTISKQIMENKRAVILPKDLRIDGKIKPEHRRRGIYESLVYTLELNISGSFAGVKTKIRALIDTGRHITIHFEKSFAVIGLSDPKGIAHTGPFIFDNDNFELSPGTGISDLLPSGFHVPLNIDPVENAPFGLNMRIKGSEGFRIAPVGEISKMHISSDWAHPSFYGDLLPASRKISGSGFEADWSVPLLVRSYPQSWIDKKVNFELHNFATGVRLFEPITLYTEATRAAKYGLLFIVLTFLTLVLMELTASVRPSMVQYGLIGVALSLFYLLLIALSEHIGFNLAYGLAALVVVCIISLYCLAVLSRKSLALVVAAVLAALYGVLFMILRAEDYALLAGSMLLLLALTVTMFFTRRLHHKKNV